MNLDVKWHVVYTKPNFERKVAQLLTQKGFDTYCPQCTVTQAEQQQVRFFKKPLFPSWVFIHCTQGQLSEIKKQSGISGSLYWKDKPAVVTNEDIATIQYVLSNFEEVCLQKTGMKPSNSNPSTQEFQTFFALPSLGYALLAQGESEKLQIHLSAMPARYRLKTTKIPYYKGNVHAILKKLPSLFMSKVIKLQAPLSGGLEQQ